MSLAKGALAAAGLLAFALLLFWSQKDTRHHVPVGQHQADALAPLSAQLHSLTQLVETHARDATLQSATESLRSSSQTKDVLAELAHIRALLQNLSVAASSAASAASARIERKPSAAGSAAPALEPERVDPATRPRCVRESR
jgi:hypothetical protein